MRKEFYRISSLDLGNLCRRIKIAAVGITFFMFGLGTVTARQTFVPEGRVENAVSTSEMTDGVRISLSENVLSTSDRLSMSFSRLCVSDSGAERFRGVFSFIRDGIGNIEAERVSVDCSSETGIIDCRFRLPHDILLSVSKPLGTEDDRNVMFSIMHGRRPVVSDIADISLLREYVENVGKRLS